MEKKYKVITCASYGGSGSSAISDLFKEFNNVYSSGDFEFTLCHDVDGISDLEFHLVENFHRMNCDEAIYRFKKLTKRLSKSYSVYIDNFDELCENYIQSLIDVTWNGSWHMHYYRNSDLSRIINYSIPGLIKGKIARFKKSDYEVVTKKKQVQMNLGRPKDRFYEETRKFMSALIDNLKFSKEGINYITMDQLVPATNTFRYIKYFDNIKIIVIDRDPRDLYLLNKMFWNEGWIPSENIDDYIKWFKLTRELDKDDNSENVLRVQFEDLIYKYNETVLAIENFIDIDKEAHINRQKYLNPSISIKNTRLWEKYNDHNEDIKKIEENLKEYLTN